MFAKSFVSAYTRLCLQKCSFMHHKVWIAYLKLNGNLTTLDDIFRERPMLLTNCRLQGTDLLEALVLMDIQLNNDDLSFKTYIIL